MREGPRPGPSGKRKEYPPGGLHYASLRSGPSHFATLRLTTSPLWAPPPTLVRGCTSPLEGIPSAVPGSHPYYCLFLRTNPGLRPSHPYFRLILRTRSGLRPSHPCFGLILRTRLGSDPSLLPSPLKHTYPVLDYLQCITPCFNHPFHPRLKHTFGPPGGRVLFNAGRKAEPSWALSWSPRGFPLAALPRIARRRLRVQSAAAPGCVRRPLTGLVGIMLTINTLLTFLGSFLRRGFSESN